MTPDPGAAYAQARTELTRFLRDHLDELDTAVPATPGWTVHDVVAHLVGTVTDVNAGRTDGMGSARWTEAQVAARRDVAPAAMLDEWERESPAFEEALRALGDVAMLAVADLASHEHDVRGALGAGGARDTERTGVAYEFYADQLGDRLATGEAPGLRLVTERGTRAVGPDEPAATVRATSFELLRALTGRRSQHQIASLDWDGDAAPYLEVFSNYGYPTETDLFED